jgi:hypothetical protein
MSDTLLNKLYYEDLNFDGLKGLYYKAKKIDPSITQKIVEEWLNKQKITKELYQNVKRKKFLPIYSNSYHAYQIDLTFLPQFKKQNDNNYVLFTAININSRFVYAYYNKNKNADTILEMLKQFKEKAKDIDSITCDSGSEFTNYEAIKWFEDNNIQMYFVVGDSHKLGIINRFHRTLKNKLLKYFKSANNVKWVDIIDKIIKNYNNTPIRTTGFTPTEAENHFIQNIIINQAEEKTNKMNDKEIFYINQFVKIKNDKKIFDKFHQQYSDDIYKITKIFKNSLNIENDETKLKVKKSNVIIVDKPENIEIIPPVIKEAMKVNKIDRVLKQVGMQEENIISTKRIKKPNSKYLN